MASKLSLGLELGIGGAVGSTLGMVFSMIEDRLKSLESKASQTKVLMGTIAEARQLGEALSAVEDKGSEAAITLKNDLAKIHKNLKDQGVDVTRLSEKYVSLGRVMEGIEQQKKGHQQIAEGKAAIASARANFKTVMVPIKASADFQAKAMDLVSTAGVPAGDEARKKEEEVSAKAVKVSQESGMASTEVLGMIGQMTAAGMKLDKALELAPVAAEFAVGQGLDGKESAKLVATLATKSGVTDTSTLKDLLGGLAQQSKGSKIGIAEVTQSLPKLLAEMKEGSAVGMEPVLRLAALLQVRGTAKGGAEEGVKGLKELASAGKLGSAEDMRKAAGDKAAQARFLSLSDNASQGGTKTFDDDFKARSDTSAYKLKDAANAYDDLKRSYGDAIRPASDLVEEGFSAVARELTSLINGSQQLVLAVSSIAAGFVALGAGIGAYKRVKGVVDVGRGLLKELRPDRGDSAGAGGGENALGRRNEPVKVAIVGSSVGASLSSPSRNASYSPGGYGPYRGRPVSASFTMPPAASPHFATVGYQTPAMAFAAPAYQARSVSPVSTIHQPPQAPPASFRSRDSAAPPARRSWTSKILGMLTGMDDSFSSLGFSAGASPVSAQPTAHSAPRSVGATSKGRGFLKAIPGGRFVDAGLMALDTFQTATTTEQKAEGYGAAAGNLGGTLAGAAAGAAIGSVVPIVGTALGGLVGAALGGMAGEDLGGWLGKRLMSRGDKSSEAASRQDQPTRSVGSGGTNDEVSGQAAMTGQTHVPAIGRVAQAMAVSAPAASLPVASSGSVQATATATTTATPAAQYFTVSPSIPITVQGNITNPDELVSQLAPAIQRMFTDLAAQANRGNQMWDNPAAAYVA
ncbi:hypothetical protein ACIP1T_04070 [Pseudomonas japonica]|uniref:hypothetical protein n=1 Tax=Pseudomonas japonica TaxID=256466 RepID=UPI003827CFAD